MSLLTFNSIGQEILLKGIVRDSTKGKSKINIVIKAKTYKVGSAHSDGTFEMTAFPNDSITFSSHRHITKSFKVSDLAKINPLYIILEPGGCDEYTPCNEKPKLYVFIGKKISVDHYIDQPNYCDFISMDSKFAAKYEVLENVYGNYKNKIIEFVGYEHGPMSKSFYDYKYVLLYVADYCGTLTHIKYQYDPLYKTTDNKWASPYNYYNYRSLSENSSIKPQKIKFKKKLKFKIPDVHDKKEIYPDLYFEIKDDVATASHGNYPAELFELKKLTTLKEFGIFLE